MSTVAPSPAESAGTHPSWITAADADWDAARAAWNLVADQHPAAVAFASTRDEVVTAVRKAAERGLRVCVQATGHSATALGSLDDTLLLRTDKLAGCEIDPDARRARVLAGTLWDDVTMAASLHGLAPLAGSSPDVGVVGYSLGGGIGWLARRHGLACNSVTAIEIVLADGRLVRCSADDEPELFWALRGGSGNFGVVVAMEFTLYPVAELVGGMLAWDWSRAGEVLRAWRDWTATVPDDVTSVARILQLPDLPEMPDFLRGAKIVTVEAALADAAARDADALLAPLRALAPRVDNFAPMPPAALIRLHNDPEQPTPAVCDHTLLDELSDGAIDEFVAVTGPGSGSPLLAAEFRHLGGALGRVSPGAGALARLEGDFLLFGVGVAADDASGAAVDAHLHRLLRAMRRYETGYAYANYADRPTDMRTMFDGPTFRRLREIRDTYDPTRLFRPAVEIR